MRQVNLFVAALLIGATASVGTLRDAAVSSDAWHPSDSVVTATRQVTLPAATPERIGRPSIHSKVMEEVMRETRPDNPSAVHSDDSSALPTSMLWPAYKYIPELRALRG